MSLPAAAAVAGAPGRLRWAFRAGSWQPTREVGDALGSRAGRPSRPPGFPPFISFCHHACPPQEWLHAAGCVQATEEARIGRFYFANDARMAMVRPAVVEASEMAVVVNHG